MSLNLRPALAIVGKMNLVQLVSESLNERPVEAGVLLHGLEDLLHKAWIIFDRISNLIGQILECIRVARRLTHVLLQPTLALQHLLDIRFRNINTHGFLLLAALKTELKNYLRLPNPYLPIIRLC